MGRPMIDMDGYKIGRLEVMETYRKNGRTYCKCLCSCGKIFEARNDSIKETGETRSCGCLLQDMVDGKVRVNVKHDKSHSKLYRIWDGMKKRCYHKKHDSYRFYGEKGVKVCDEWKNNFASFDKWAMENGYKEGLSIERLDNSKDYSPDNCTWIELANQHKNRRDLVYQTIHGEKMYLAEIARKYNINESTIRNRFRKGKRNEELLTR